METQNLPRQARDINKEKLPEVGLLFAPFLVDVVYNHLAGQHDDHLIAVVTGVYHLVADRESLQLDLGTHGVQKIILRKRSVFEFSLCLSQACLDKMSVLIYKWLKRTVSHGAGHHLWCASLVEEPPPAENGPFFGFPYVCPEPVLVK
jgi:hypothetical protein